MSRQQLLDRMKSLGVGFEDLEESFSRPGGPGGQHANKVSSAATIRHRPTRLTVTAADSRSQAENRRLALGRLLDLLEMREQQSRQAQLAAVSTARRQNPRRSRRKQALLIEDKRHRGEIKRLRSKIEPDT